MWRRFFVAFDINPRVAIVGSNDAVRHHFDVFLHNVIFKLTTNQTLNSEQRVFWVSHGLAFCAGANQHFVVCVSNNRWRSARAFRVLNNFNFVAIQNSYAAVGGAQIDTNNSTHDALLLARRRRLS